jgi:hypothetical protein
MIPPATLPAILVLAGLALGFTTSAFAIRGIMPADVGAVLGFALSITTGAAAYWLGNEVARAEWSRG